MARLAQSREIASPTGAAEPERQVSPGAPSAPASLPLDLGRRAPEVPRPHRVYVNRNLRLDQIKLVGFDMDYTLALYDQARVEELSVLATLHKLVANKGYPEAVRTLPYDPRLAIRGLVVDLEAGNVFKPDRYGTPGQVMHGRQVLDRARVTELYHRARTPLGHQRYAWIDSLFALPEAVLYVDLVEFFDAYDGAKPSYPELWRDIRECIDLAHRDGSIKTIVAAELPKFVERDPGLGETLHRLRSSGKDLFLLTNSEWAYTDPVMSYLLDGVLPAYPSWRNYFDVVVASASKPGFFSEGRPFVELDPRDGKPLPALHGGPLLRGRVYAGGNVRDLEARVRARGNEILYVGDHIYGDMMRTRKASTWRTAMILQELEHEVSTHDRLLPELGRLDDLERRLRHLDAAIADTQGTLRGLQKREDKAADDPGGLQGTPGEVAEAKRGLKADLDRLRAELQARMQEHRTLEADLAATFNPFWGPLFNEGHEVSKFGEQVEAYACVYTSRVSNLRFYSPNHHFRGPRDRMPHER